MESKIGSKWYIQSYLRHSVSTKHPTMIGFIQLIRTDDVKSFEILEKVSLTKL